MEINLEQYIINNKFHVFIKPKARATEILGYNKEKQAMIIAVKAVPEKGEANKELVKFLTKLLRRKVIIKSGLTSRSKVMQIE